MRRLSREGVLGLVPFAALAGTGGWASAQDEVVVQVSEHRARDDERLRYELLAPEVEEPPRDGYKLLLVLPGEGTEAATREFVRNLSEEVVGTDYLVAHLEALGEIEDPDEEAGAGRREAKRKRLSPEESPWPTRRFHGEGAELVTEDFVAAVIEDVAAGHPIDSRFVFALGWSTSGSAVYASALTEETRLTGAFVAMSVFKPAQLPALDAAKGRPFYLLHSPGDWIPFRMAEQARDHLKSKGGKVRLVQYDGGHGWHGDVSTKIRTGLTWLERNHARPNRRRPPSTE